MNRRTEFSAYALIFVAGCLITLTFMFVNFGETRKVSLNLDPSTLLWYIYHMADWGIIFYQTSRGDEPVKEFLNQLNLKDKRKVYRYIEYIRQFGPNLPQPYLKKIAGYEYLWELRPSRIRIFLTFLPKHHILLIHSLYKKSQKTPRQDLILANQRLKEYLV